MIEPLVVLSPIHQIVGNGAVNAGKAVAIVAAGFERPCQYARGRRPAAGKRFQIAKFAKRCRSDCRIAALPGEIGRLPQIYGAFIVVAADGVHKRRAQFAERSGAQPGVVRALGVRRRAAQAIEARLDRTGSQSRNAGIDE